MHLDLSHLLDDDTLQGIDELAEDFLYSSPHVLWPHWLAMYDDADLPPVSYQAAAQQLAAHACLFSCIQFGLYCSRHYAHHGLILSDDVATYYLKTGFKALANEKDKLVRWLSKDKPVLDYPGFETNYWRSACSIYLKHAVANQHTYDSTMEFAEQFVTDRPRN